MIEGKQDQVRIKRWMTFFMAAAILVFALRVVFPERGYDDLGWRAWWDSAFALALLALIFLLGGILGEKILRFMNIKRMDLSGRLAAASGIGWGVTAYGVFFLGLTGLLFPLAISLWLVILLWICRTELLEILEYIPRVREKFRGMFNDWDYAKKGLLVLIAGIIGLNVIQALTPPWGYDALMYHLQAPRLFLQQNSITLLPDIWQANGPITIEMLYAIGLAAGSDVFARLVHLSFMGLLFAGTFSLGRKLLGETGGWLSLAILAGIPILPIWGNLAYTDMALALYSLLTFIALAWWCGENDNAYLRLAGLSMGFALGSKYTALGTGLVVGLWIVILCLREGWKKALRKAMNFAVPAVLIGSPWYAKNWVMAGNPVFPFLFGGPGWDMARLEAVNNYLMDAFGTGRGVWDYLLLPFNLYAQHGAFGTSFSTIEFPSFLFPLVILYPLARRMVRLDAYFWLLIIMFGIWALGSQQTRFLIPIYPLLSVFSSLCLLWVGKQISKPIIRRTMAVGFLGGFVAVSLVYQISHQVGVNPYPVILGMESKSDFLSRIVYDYRSIEFIKNSFGEHERVLMMWDGQGYYCDERCVPDADQTRWLRLSRLDLSPLELSQKLTYEGYSYILVDIEGLSFFSYYDVDNRNYRASQFLFDEFIPQCADEIFRDDKIVIFELVC